MDESRANIDIITTKAKERAPETRDENRSPTSGSSSEAYAEEGRRMQRNRKQSSASRPKRKRKWKPYNELSWDERMVQDDRETRRAYAKRERLTAEGHPIAPYNTTQFLMEDRRTQTCPKNLVLLGSSGDWSPAPTRATANTRNLSNNNTLCEKDMVATEELEQIGNKNTKNSVQGMVTTSNNCQSLTELNESAVKAGYGEKGDQPSQKNLQASSAESLQTAAGSVSVEKQQHGSNRDNSQNGEDIQKYIMDDFSHTYADIHAEQLQGMSKADLVEECLKLEKRVDTLERRVKDCRRKHKHDQKGRADVHLLEKINQLQVLNAELQKDKEFMEKPDSSMPVSDLGAHI